MKFYTIILFYFTTASAGILVKKPAIFAERSKDGRIVGGIVADHGDFNFIVAINVSTANASFLCGGTILTLHHILTAGHCVDGATRFQVLMGSSKLDDKGSHVQVSQKSILHPDYDGTTLQNNLGFVLFEEELEFSFEHIWPITHYPDADLKPGVEVVVAGWGHTSDSKDTPSNDLYFIKLKTISNEECGTFYGGQIKDDMACAVGTKGGTCTGDSGGPVLVEENGVKKLYAIASFISGNGCEDNYPSGFTRLRPHWSWITDTSYIVPRP